MKMARNLEIKFFLNEQSKKTCFHVFLLCDYQRLLRCDQWRDNVIKIHNSTRVICTFCKNHDDKLTLKGGVTLIKLISQVVDGKHVNWLWFVSDWLDSSKYRKFGDFFISIETELQSSSGLQLRLIDYSTILDCPDSKWSPKNEWKTNPLKGYQPSPESSRKILKKLMSEVVIWKLEI